MIMSGCFHLANRVFFNAPMFDQPLGAEVPRKLQEALAAARAKARAAVANRPSALAVPANNAASAQRSGPPSSAGIAVLSADDLRKELFELCRPDMEPLAVYLSRVGRLVLALKAQKPW